MAESIYEWDCDNIKQMSWDLKIANEELKKYVDKYGKIKEVLAKSWMGGAGTVLLNLLDIDFDRLNQISDGVKELAGVLDKATTQYYPNCNADIDSLYNQMKSRNQ